MDFSIVPVSKVFKTYQGQAQIAELNKKNPVKNNYGGIGFIALTQDGTSKKMIYAVLIYIERRIIKMTLVPSVIHMQLLISINIVMYRKALVRERFINYFLAESAGYIVK